MRTFKILIIEDSEKDALVYQTYLQNSIVHKFDIHFTTTGKEGIDLVKKKLYDCVILDHILPDMTSVEFLDVVKPREVSTPIVMITGYCDQDMDQKMIQMGVADYLDKNEVYPKLLERIIVHAIERHRLAQELIATNEAKELFLKHVSEKVRIPIQTLIRQCDTFFSDQMDRSSHAHMLDILKGIHSSAKKQLALLNQLMMKSILKTEKQSVELKYFDIQEVLKLLKDVYEKKAEKKGVELKVYLSGENRPLFLDEKKIFTVVECLIDNAIKFTKKGSVELKALVSEEQLKLVIRDTGIGVSETNASRVFSPYTHGSPQIARNFGGLGNGLAIAKYFVELHGGRILLKPREEGGTVVKVVVPLKKIEKAPTVTSNWNMKKTHRVPQKIKDAPSLVTSKVEK